MPLYVYRCEDASKACDACRAAFEVLQRMSDRPLAKCPECGAPLKKQVTTANSAFPKGPAALRNMGMARLEKRSDGNYENVSAQEGHQRVGALDSFAADLAKGPKPVIGE